MEESASMKKFETISRGEIQDQVLRHGYAPEFCEHVVPPPQKVSDRKTFYGRRNDDGHLIQVVCVACRSAS